MNKKGYSQIITPILLIILLIMFVYKVEKVTLSVIVSDNEITDIDFVKQNKPLIFTAVNPSPPKGDLSLQLIATDCISGDLIYKNSKTSVGDGIIWYGDIDVNNVECLKINLELKNGKSSSVCKIFELENGEKREEKSC